MDLVLDARKRTSRSSDVGYPISVQDFTKLRVWRHAHELSLAVVNALPQRIGRAVPGLRTQAIRAATSVASNIAEGCAHSTRLEFLHFVEIAHGSLNELQSQLLLARDAHLLQAARHAQLQRDVDLNRRMLVALMRTLQRRIAEDEFARRRKKEA